MATTFDMKKSYITIIKREFAMRKKLPSLYKVYIHQDVSKTTFYFVQTCKYFIISRRKWNLGATFLTSYFKGDKDGKLFKCIYVKIKIQTRAVESQLVFVRP